METNPGMGDAHGWAVSQSVTTGRWLWSAYGPFGGAVGTRATQAEAEEAAREAERQCCPVARPVVGD